MKIKVHKISSSTKNVRLSAVVEMSAKIQAKEGSILIVKALEENPAYGSVELMSGRMSKVIEGDILACTLGERKASTGFYGYIPAEIKQGGKLNLLNFGGVIGKAVSGNPEFGKPIEVEVMGQALIFPTFNERIGKPANIAETHIPWKEALKESVPLIMVSASSMDSGKTTAACELIKGLTSKGYNVAGGKLTGVSLMRDTLNMEDYGGVKALNFNDTGVVSTTGKKTNELSKGIIHELNKLDIHCLVLELGDGILGSYGVRSILCDEEIMRFTEGHIVCANDHVAAWGVKEIFKELGLKISLISGRVTDNAVGVEFIERELNLPAANAITESDKLVAIIEEEVFNS